MAARLRPQQVQNTRDLIGTTQLVKRLMKHALANKDVMTKSQVQAANILLRKTVPDLNHNEVDQNVTVNLIDVIRTIEHKRDSKDLRALEDLSTTIRN